MVFIVVCLFNSIRTTILIWLIMPLFIIAVTAGLLLTRMPFGFMALLGVLALGGELIKNQIVVLSKILTLIDKGTPPYQALLDAGTAKMRPVCMVVLTTVLGMFPLVTDPFFGAMAVCIMFGLVVCRRPVPDRDARALRDFLQDQGTQRIACHRSVEIHHQPGVQKMRTPTSFLNVADRELFGRSKAAGTAGDGDATAKRVLFGGVVRF